MVVWLGSTYEDSDLAFDFMLKVVEDGEKILSGM
jgi:hypothetical protein